MGRNRAGFRRSPCGESRGVVGANVFYVALGKAFVSTYTNKREVVNEQQPNAIRQRSPWQLQRCKKND